MAAKDTKGKSASHGPDLATIAGLVLAVGGILLGQRLEGGHASQIVGGPAALIVLGGTLGAVLISTPLSMMMSALGRLKEVFFEKRVQAEAMIDEIIRYATKARKSGIVSLEHDAEAIEDPFLRKALCLAIDGADLQELRKMMELEIDIEEQRDEAEIKVLEAAGGYSPTIGIIGAVIGLIEVMQDLTDTEKVGRGIATAFIATIYGVAFANIFCLPAATKMKSRSRARTQMRELILEGVIGIVEGLNPKLIRLKLEAYVQATPAKAKAKAKAGAGKAARTAPVEG